MGHEALLTLARKVEAAAADGDPARVEDAARHLLNLLAVHVRAEEAALSGCPPSTAQSVQKGQDRLLALVGDLAAHAAQGCAASAQECRYRTEDLLVRLEVQARTERLTGLEAAA